MSWFASCTPRYNMSAKKNQQLCKLYTSIKTTLPAAYPDTQIPLIQYTCNFAEKLDTVCLPIKTNKFTNKPKSEYLQ